MQRRSMRNRIREGYKRGEDNKKYGSGETK
jgi:hypothetical protein